MEPPALDARALQLLRRHIEASWGLRVPPLAPGDVEIAATDGAAPWVLYAARLDGAEVRVWRPVSGPARTALREAARLALAGSPSAGVPMEVVLGRLPSPPRPQGLARRLGDADRGLLEAFEPGETAYWLDPRRAPLFGVVEDGRLLSIAHSSRRTTQACELGINTLPEARRRGLARECVLAWADAVAAEGLEPLYSASATNAPSLALARACGYRPIALAAQVPQSTVPAAPSPAPQPQATAPATSAPAPEPRPAGPTPAGRCPR